MAQRSVCPKCCNINRIGDSGKLIRCPKCKNFYCPVCKIYNIVGSVDKIYCLNLNCNRTYERSELEKKLLPQNIKNDPVFLKKDDFDGNIHKIKNEENNQDESFCSKIPHNYGVEEKNNCITISNYVDKNNNLKMPKPAQEQQSDTPIDIIGNIIKGEDIIQISRSEVELKWYENYKQNFEKRYFILFEKLDIILDNLIKSHRFPLYLNEISPKFANKYLSIYKYQNPETREWFIRDYVTRALVGDRFFKKILDKKAYGAIIYRWRFLGESNRNKHYYLGVTTRKEEIRFALHIADSIIKYSEKGTMTKKAEIIIQALKTHGLKEADFSYYYSQIHHKKFYEIGDAVMSLVKECEYLFEREILEIHKSISTAIHKEKLYIDGLIDGINYLIDGLNEIHGGGGGISLDLPMYDVSMMITFGFEYKTIKEFLLRFYDIEVSVRQIKKRISSYFSGDYNKSSRYNANKEFLKPLIEILLYEQFLGKLDEKKYPKILNFLKSIFEKEDKLKLKTWFWAFYRGDFDLDFIYWENYIKDINISTFNEWFIMKKRYYGISKSTWVNWIINRIPLRKIYEEANLSKKKVKRVRERLHSKEILDKFQQYITIKYRQEGNSWKKIYEDKLNYTAFHRTDINGIKYGPDFFERMFQIPFHRLTFETFSEIDLNKIAKWNNIDFSKL